MNAGNESIQMVSGGVCAAKGFKAAGVYCGIRKNPNKKDLALIVSETKANAAAVYTTNLVKGAPLTVTKTHISDGKAQAVICNSGNANTCNADGIEIAETMSKITADALGIAAGDVVVASAGVIGQPLSVKPIAAAIPKLVDELSPEGSGEACSAIMTTDTKKKEIAVEFMLGGKTCRLGGIAKGSGMIHPNMATMLVFLTTDAAISAGMLQKALSGDIQTTFNMISVDGDTSTNDMVTILANGLAGNEVYLPEFGLPFLPGTFIQTPVIEKKALGIRGLVVGILPHDYGLEALYGSIGTCQAAKPRHNHQYYPNLFHNF